MCLNLVVAILAHSASANLKPFKFQTPQGILPQDLCKRWDLASSAAIHHSGITAISHEQDFSSAKTISLEATYAAGF